MKRLLVAASVAAFTFPVVGTVAHAAPAAAPAVSSAAPAAAFGSHPAQPSVSALRASAVNHANRYSRMAPRVGWRQKHRNAQHLSRLTHQARLHHTTRAVYIARSQMGTPYRFGGTTAAGFDCSGFTQYVYRKSNKRLPRTAAQQFRATQPTRNPRPGDLVFFGGRNAHHVGIYVGGNRMIHSPRTGRSVEVVPVWRGASYRTLR